MKPCQKALKNKDFLELISSLGKFVSVDESIPSNCQQFIETVLCSRTTKESDVETRVKLYDNHKIENSIILPLDPLSCN